MEYIGIHCRFQTLCQRYSITTANAHKAQIRLTRDRMLTNDLHIRAQDG
jgi:hypothetical protein